MNNPDIQKKCEEFLHSLGLPGFIVFGWQKGGKGAQKEYGVVYSVHKMPTTAVVKGLSGTLSHFVNQVL